MTPEEREQTISMMKKSREKCCELKGKVEALHQIFLRTKEEYIHWKQQYETLDRQLALEERVTKIENKKRESKPSVEKQLSQMSTEQLSQLIGMLKAAVKED